MSKSSGRAKTYVAKPAPPSETARRRFEVVRAVMAGTKTQEEAATELGLSRHRFQVLLHRSEAAMMAALDRGEAGRPAKPQRERELEAEAVRLQRQNARLRERTEMIDRMLGVAGDILRGRREINGAPARRTSDDDGEDPEPGQDAQRKAAHVAVMRELGLRQDTAAALVSASAPTVRRWSARLRDRQPPCRRRGPSLRLPSSVALQRAEDLVRALRGQLGVDALAHSAGLTRRQAAVVKHAVRTEMERERKEACGRVVVTCPGIVRGFDQLVVPTNAGRTYALLSADAAVPYRTSVTVVERYDEDAVAAAVSRDFERNGAPLVWRADRCASHRTAKVLGVLAGAGVLPLFGPPRHPQYYGQLERQNREHRAALATVTCHDPADLLRELEDIFVALNELRRRPSLSWRTAAEAWQRRRVIAPSERARFAAHVYDLFARLTAGHHVEPDLAMRLAIEQALKEEGHLSISWGQNAIGFRQCAIAH